MSKKSATDLAIIRQGATSEFWKLICKIVDENIRLVEEQMESENMDDLPADEYKVMSQVLKLKKKMYLSLKDLPKSFLESKKLPDQSTPNFDPYGSAKDFVDN